MSKMISKRKLLRLIAELRTHVDLTPKSNYDIGFRDALDTLRYRIKVKR